MFDIRSTEIKSPSPPISVLSDCCNKIQTGWFINNENFSQYEGRKSEIRVPRLLRWRPSSGLFERNPADIPLPNGEQKNRMGRASEAKHKSNYHQLVASPNSRLPKNLFYILVLSGSKVGSYSSYSCHYCSIDISFEKELQRLGIKRGQQR